MKTSDKVYNHIKGNIVNGVWQAGDKITPELTLVEELQVSRMSVREAIEKLVTLGLLRKQRGGGTYVNEVTSSTYMNALLPLLTLNRTSYLEILQFRIATDVLAVKLFIETDDPESLNELSKTHNLMINSTDKPEMFFKYDMKFHRILAHGSGNSILYKMTELLFDITEHYSGDEYHLLPMEQRILEHQKIYDAVIEKDKELASLYVKRHLERTINELKANIK